MKYILLSLVILYICSSHLSEIVCGKIFNVIDYEAVGNGETDDSEAFLRAWQDVCGAKTSDIPTLEIPEETTFLLQPTKFQGPCNNRVNFKVMGTLVAPETPEDWNKPVNSFLISFSEVHNLTVSGSGLIDGRGSSWWANNSTADHQRPLDTDYQDQDDDDKCRECARPKSLRFQGCRNLVLNGITLVNSPKGHISMIHCSYVIVANLTITAPEDSPNTDGIDIAGSKFVDIRSSYIGTGDDCIAISSGCSNFTISNITCGPGHGISVGSLGRDGAFATVENVYVKNCSFNRTSNGVRIKTWQGGSGYAKNITFEQIRLEDVKNPIIIDQYYCNGEHGCKNKTPAVEVRDVTYRDIKGTSAKKQAIRFDCNQFSGCRNITLDNVDITSYANNGDEEVVASCYNIYGTFNNTFPSVPCFSDATSLEPEPAPQAPSSAPNPAAARTSALFYFPLRYYNYQVSYFVN